MPLITSAIEKAYSKRLAAMFLSQRLTAMFLSLCFCRCISAAVFLPLRFCRYISAVMFLLYKNQNFSTIDALSSVFSAAQLF